MIDFLKKIIKRETTIIDVFRTLGFRKAMFLVWFVVLDSNLMQGKNQFTLIRGNSFFDIVFFAVFY